MTSSQRPPGRPRDPAARTAILAAARALLDEGGLPAVTMEGVARRAGVGKPTIYRHWPNAPAVAMAAFLETAAPPATSDRNAAPLDALRGQLAAIAAAFAERTGRNIKAMIAASQGETELAKAFRNQFIAASRAGGRALLERAIHAGEIRTGPRPGGDPRPHLRAALLPPACRPCPPGWPIYRRAARPGSQGPVGADPATGKAKGPPAGADGPRRCERRPGQPSTSTDPRTGAGTSTSLCSEEPGVAPEPPGPASPVPPGAAWVRRGPPRAPALVEPLIPFNQPGRDGATCPSSRPRSGPSARRGPPARSRAWWPRSCTAGSWRRPTPPSG